MAILWTARVIILSVVLLFAIINLGICAGFIAKLANFDGGRFDISAPAFAVLGLAVSVITLVVVGPMCVSLSLHRRFKEDLC